MRVFLNPDFKKQDVKITQAIPMGTETLVCNVYPMYPEGSVGLRLVLQSLWQENHVQILLIRSDFHV